MLNDKLTINNQMNKIITFLPKYSSFRSIVNKACKTKQRKELQLEDPPEEQEKKTDNGI